MNFQYVITYLSLPIRDNCKCVKNSKQYQIRSISRDCQQTFFSVLQVGVGAFILNDKQQVLMVQEANGILKDLVSCQKRSGESCMPCSLRYSSSVNVNASVEQ